MMSFGADVVTSITQVDIAKLPPRRPQFPHPPPRARCQKAFSGLPNPKLVEGGRTAVAQAHRSCRRRGMFARGLAQPSVPSPDGQGNRMGPSSPQQQRGAARSPWRGPLAWPAGTWGPAGVGQPCPHCTPTLAPAPAEPEVTRAS